jgi:hypothetical protein
MSTSAMLGTHKKNVKFNIITSYKNLLTLNYLLLVSAVNYDMFWKYEYFETVVIWLYFLKCTKVIYF